MDRLHPPATHHARAVLSRLALVLRRVTSDMAGDALLDFGSGPAPYRSLFPGFASYVTADLATEDADLDISDGLLPAQSESFDLVLSTQVLEHVPNPDQYLTEAHRVLAPGGTLILSTHGIYWFHPAPEDFWRWTRPGLQLQIERCGFEVDEIVPVISAPAAALNMFFQYTAELAIHPRLRPTWHYVTQRLVTAIDRVAHLRGATSDDACVFLVIAHRPREPADFG